MKPCHVLSLSLSPKAALTTRASCFPVDVPCHEHVPKGKSLCWTSPMNVCLWDRPAARGKWDTETTPEENISKGSRIKIQPGTILTPTQGAEPSRGTSAPPSAAREAEHTPMSSVWKGKTFPCEIPELCCLLAAESTSPAPAKDKLQINKDQLLEVIGVHGSRLEQKEGSGI